MGILADYPRFQAFDDNGHPLIGGALWTFDAGTSTLKATYHDKNNQYPQTNPIVLNSFGEASFFLGEGDYKFVLCNPRPSSLPPIVLPDEEYVRWTQDDIQSPNYTRSVVAKVANYTLTESDLDGSKTFTNTGSTGVVILSLPPGQLGMFGSILVTDANYLTLQSTGTDKFRWGQESGSTGGYITSEEVGTYVNFMYSGSEWVISSITNEVNYSMVGAGEGTWSMAPLNSDELGLELEWVSATTFKVWEGVIADSTVASFLRLTSPVEKTISAFTAGTGNGSLIGTIAAEKFLNVYIIRDPTTGAVDIATDQTESDPTLPGDFTEFKWLGVLYVNADSELEEFEHTKGIPHIITYPGEIQVESLSTGSTPVSSIVDVSDFFPTSFPNIVNVGIEAYDFACTTPSYGCGSLCYQHGYTTTYAKIYDSQANALTPDGGLWEGTEVQVGISIVQPLCTASASASFAFKLLTFNR